MAAFWSAGVWLSLLVALNALDPSAGWVRWLRVVVGAGCIVSFVCWFPAVLSTRIRCRRLRGGLVPILSAVILLGVGLLAVHYGLISQTDVVDTGVTMAAMGFGLWIMGRIWKGL